MSAKPKVLILGGGFGGIKAALELAESPAYEISLLSDQANFRYYPTLYRAATGGRTSASSIPLSDIFAGKNVSIEHGAVKTLDRAKKQVKTGAGKIYAYDILIVALGVETNYFGIKGLDKYAYGIKTLDDAKALRDHIHKQLVHDQKPDLNYVVIGGGPTGVELAGELPHYIARIMVRHKLKNTRFHVDLVEAQSRLMPNMPTRYSRAVTRRLRKLGVKTYLGQKVQAETADKLIVSGHSIDSHSVVWTAGVTNHPFLKDNDFPLNARGKVEVDQYLAAEKDIYVIGDNAATPYSGMAQTALRDGNFVAKNLKRLVAGQTAVAYAAKKPIYITPVGSYWAAVLWGKVMLFGWLGWLLREAGDAAGYHDYEPWWKTTKLLAAELSDEDSCPTCSQ